MKRKRTAIGLGVIAVLALGGVLLFIWSQYREGGLRGMSYQPPPIVFEGDSKELRQTVIVPTLDTSMPPGKNVIWCGTFQLAWNRMNDDVIKAPQRIAGAEEVVARLNRARITEDDLPDNSYYAAAGWVGDGIVEKIRTEMLARFNHTARIEASDQTAAVAYAFLEASVPFATPFLENQRALIFEDGRGNKTAVTSFGTQDQDLYDGVPDEMFDQVEILYAAVDEENEWSLKEFAIDPCRHSTPHQILLVQVEPKATLADTLEYIEQEIAHSPPSDEQDRFAAYDVLAVPNLNWEIIHRFAELEGRHFLNPGFEGLYIEAAYQIIQFRLDRNGAHLLSEAQESVACAPRCFIFDKPFLILMKKRGRKHPFFVMWVDNAELLCKP